MSSDFHLQVAKRLKELSAEGSRQTLEVVEQAALASTDVIELAITHRQRRHEQAKAVAAGAVDLSIGAPVEAVGAVADASLKSIRSALWGSSRKNAGKERDQKKVEKRNPPPTDDTQDRNCIICFENERAEACVPCGHFVMCSDCAKAVRVMSGDCPICQRPIESYLRTFCS